MVVTARENFYISIQLAYPFCKMVNIIKRKISEMVDSIIFGNNAIPFFDHYNIHLVHAFKWTIEILNCIFIVEMCIGGKECLHDKHLTICIDLGCLGAEKTQSQKILI